MCSKWKRRAISYNIAVCYTNCFFNPEALQRYNVYVIVCTCVSNLNCLCVVTRKKNRTLLSVPDRAVRFNWSPGAEKLRTAPGGSWRRDDPGWVKGRAKIHGDLRPACACVCV